jgi:hypothetical protein
LGKTCRSFKKAHTYTKKNQENECFVHYFITWAMYTLGKVYLKLRWPIANIWEALTSTRRRNWHGHKIKYKPFQDGTTNFRKD